MNWMITFEKFNEYYEGQTAVSIIAIIFLAMAIGMTFDSDGSGEKARSVLIKIIIGILIYHAILTPLWLLCPVK